MAIKNLLNVIDIVKIYINDKEIGYMLSITHEHKIAVKT